MRKVEDLKQGDYIAFTFNYNGGEPNEIMVAQITSKHDDGFITHFSYGHHSLSEFITKKDILGIGNLEGGKTKLHGWSGKFDIVQPEHPLVVNNQKDLLER